MAIRVSALRIVGALAAALLISFALAPIAAEEDSPVSSAEEARIVEDETVVTLHAANFSYFVSQRDFLVVEFYAPWCGHCQALAPEYEKAARLLGSLDPPIILAKVDANEEDNRELAARFDVQGFPTIKILRNGGSSVQDYKGPREAEGIVEYIKKQLGPASVEIKTAEDATNLIDEKQIFIVGVFPKYSGPEYETFITTAEKLRGDYSFGHTLDARLLPRGESTEGPVVRLLKPFDERVVDHKDFQEFALEQFIEIASVPLVVTFNTDPANVPYLEKYFTSESAKAMLFLNFTVQNFEAYKSQFYGAAEHYKGKGLKFLLGDLEAAQSALEYFGVKGDQTPLLVVLQNESQKYLKFNVEPDQISPWLSEYTDGKLTPYTKSEPIPEVNNEPVKVVVAKSLHDIVFNSGKNVLLEFYAPWCGHCQKLAPILEEVAITLQNEEDVVIAKMDATANDVPSEFDVQGFPTLYLYSTSGNLLPYEGGRTAEEIIEFIKKNKDGAATEGTTHEAAFSDSSDEFEATSSGTTSSAPVKDEL